MRIRKVTQSTALDGKIVNSASDSTTETYSANFINSKFSNLISVVEAEYIQFQGTTAGESGYKTFTVSIPAGCRAFCTASIGQIGNSNGLQLTVGNPNKDNSSSSSAVSQTVYLNYYAPKAISSNCRVVLTAWIFKVN